MFRAGSEMYASDIAGVDANRNRPTTPIATDHHTQAAKAKPRTVHSSERLARYGRLAADRWQARWPLRAT